MEKQYLPGKEIIFTRFNVVEVVLPALESASKKKFIKSFSAEQRKYERLEKQIQRERRDASQRLLLERKDFLRSNSFFKERRRSSSRVPLRREVRDFKENVLERNWKHAELQEKHPSAEFLNRSPYFLPPLYKNVGKDLKEIQTNQLRIELAKKESVDIKDIKNCRYLRLRSAQELDCLAEHSELENENLEKVKKYVA